MAGRPTPLPIFRHTLSHAVVVHRHGLGVPAITPHVVGGVPWREEENER